MLMKICLVDYDFPPSFAGTETHNYSLVKYLMNKGHDVHVIILRLDGEKRSEVEKSMNDVNKGINLYNIYVDEYKIKFPLMWYPRYLKVVKEIEKTGKIDIFDIHKSIFALHLNKKRNIVYSLHFKSLTCPTGYGVNCSYNFDKCRKKCNVSIKDILAWKFIDFLTKDKFDKFIVKKKSLYNDAIKFGYPGDKLEIVPYWLDYKKINFLANKHIINKFRNYFVFLYPTRLHPSKGHLLLLEAFYLLLKRKKNVVLYLIGLVEDDELKNKIINFCKKKNMENNVILTGMLPRNKVLKSYSIGDCMLSLRLDDNYSWALLEEMCTGKPLIATDVGPTRDILKDNYNALLVKPDPEVLCDKMEFIMENKEVGLELGRNALKTIKEMHSYRNIEKIEKLFRELTKQV